MSYWLCAGNLVYEDRLNTVQVQYCMCNFEKKKVVHCKANKYTAFQ